MREEEAHYILNNVIKKRKLEVCYSILVPKDEPMYIREQITKEEVVFIDQSTKDEFETFDKVVEYVKDKGL